MLLENLKRNRSALATFTNQQDEEPLSSELFSTTSWYPRRTTCGGSKRLYPMFKNISQNRKTHHESSRKLFPLVSETTYNESAGTSNKIVTICVTTVLGDYRRAYLEEHKCAGVLQCAA
jgi:hypothetical protein